MINLGLAAEHLVCADLILQGHMATLSPQMSAYDLIADINGRLLRVQVKSTSAPAERWHINKAPRYRFKLQKGGGNKSNPAGKRKDYSPNEVDLFALVALDIKAIAYIPVTGEITNNLEFYRTRDESMRRSTSRVITEYPLTKALEELK